MSHLVKGCHPDQGLTEVSDKRRFSLVGVVQPAWRDLLFGRTACQLAQTAGPSTPRPLRFAKEANRESTAGASLRMTRYGNLAPG